MRVLIVESDPDLGRIWKKHIERADCTVDLAGTQEAAIDLLQTQNVAVIILDLVLEHGSAFAIADFASYRRPEARVVFVTNTTFFSDGSIFQHIPNVRAFLQRETPPDDLAAIVEYHGRQA
ncbi:MAG: response regulator [Halocynthiibacter sp.]